MSWRLPHRPLVVATVVGFVLVASVTAEELKSGQEKQVNSPRAAAHFSAQIVAIDELLQASEAKKAFRRSELLYNEMIQKFISGPDINLYLARALGLRAIADCQLGRLDKGLWDWHVAVQLLPSLERVDLEVYGEAGLYLRDHPVRKTVEEPDILADSEEAKAGSWEPPRRKKGLGPKFPRGRRSLKQEVVVIVEAIIGTDGRPYDPVIIETAGELTLVAATLEAMRLWEFEPARFMGEPVEVKFELSVNFRVLLR